MPHLPTVDDGSKQELVFPPVTKDHIQNCSYNEWFPKYRSSCIKSRIIPLSTDFVSYLNEDGIVLADDEESGATEEEDEWATTTTTSSRVREIESDDEDEEDEPDRLPPNQRFPEIHQLIKAKIAELGGAVVPKLNWSSPKDAKWISPHQNTLKCTSPNDIYLLLKSSSFISHDLHHAFDGCTSTPPTRPYAPVLVLRPFFNPHVALEFRCFVKHRSLIAITQRDLNYYSFLNGLKSNLTRKIKAFFDNTLRFTFPDASFAFDVYVPESAFEDDGLGKVRLIDINPWAPRTDSLLFDWQELLEWEVANPLYGSPSTADANGELPSESGEDTTATSETDEERGADGGVVRIRFKPDEEPKFRIIERDDPAAFNFSSSQYSAHKLPKEVVDASLSGEGGIREFAQQWKELTEGRADGIWEQAAGLNK